MLIHMKYLLCLTHGDHSIWLIFRSYVFHPYLYILILTSEDLNIPVVERFNLFLCVCRVHTLAVGQKTATAYELWRKNEFLLLLKYFFNLIPKVSKK